MWRGVPLAPIGAGASTLSEVPTDSVIVTPNVPVEARLSPAAALSVSVALMVVAPAARQTASAAVADAAALALVAVAVAQARRLRAALVALADLA